jgi:hypothetical protein
VKIPNAVIQIDDFAFDGCEELSELVIPDSVKYIGNGVFFECKSLEKIYLPDSIVKIGNSALYGCESLDKIYIPSGTKVKFEALIPEYADLLVEEILVVDNIWRPYEDTYSLKEIWDITLPGRYEEIDGDVAEVIGIDLFSGKRALRISIPFTDGSSVSLKLSPLSNLKEGDKVLVSSIKGQEYHKNECNPIICYNGKKYLSTAVTKDDLANAWTDGYGVKYSSDRKRLLKAPNNLNKYLVKSGTIVICNKAFCQCKELQSVQFPNSVTTIGDFAFYNCEKLTSAIIPKSVTNMGMCVFEGCERLSDYHPFE